MTASVSLRDLVQQRLATRILERDPLAFVGPQDLDAHTSIRNRLGWLDAPEAMLRHVEFVEDQARAALADGLSQVYLLGMGGSSLCAEVLRDIASPRRPGATLTVLDTTDEHAIRTAMAGLVPNRSLFLVASKSGSTIEVASLQRHFESVMTAAVGQGAGRHFAAITDPGTPLVSHAKAAGYRHTFVNPADIGGRYSALSLFGLVPAALLGLDLRALLESAARMAQQCRDDAASNPGLALGAFMAMHAMAGRDKLTLIADASLAPFGAWVEQLVAESTGKAGVGVLPVTDEPAGDATDYGPDRAFVGMFGQDAHSGQTTVRALAAAGHPVFTVDATASGLGGEFYRWEFATAVAGAALRINPFDEPNVRAAKVYTQSQLDARAGSGLFRVQPPLGPLADGILVRHHPGEGTRVPGGRYLAILDYLPADGQHHDAVARLRAAVRRRTGLATTYGVGPRYLHSTGQYHKGGPNTGRFVVITAADRTQTPIPGTDYTFSVLKEAQALGDFEALAAAGRDVTHYHVTDPEMDLSGAIDRIALELG